MDGGKLMNTFYNTIQMTIFDQIKTTNPVVNAIVTTLLLSLFGSFLSFINHRCDDINFIEIIYNLAYRVPNKIKICGKNCTNPTTYGELYVSSAYSEGFNAMVDYIIKNIETTSNIREIKELYSNSNISGREAISQFIVSQTKEFYIDADIFIKIINRKEDCEDAKKNSFQIENISIEIFSYKYSLSELKQYFDKILSRYKISIQTGRNNKKFIYTVEKVFLKDDECKLSRWNEDEFKSNRTFDNLFFENKAEILKKIEFFINNKSWYDEKGIPHNLGIGLHGLPGTGKTSFIKALANKTNRDIVIIPLKLIKTVSQLKTIFFEDTYTRLNGAGSKSFDKKIIVFEDIDCIGDIVKDRMKLLLEREKEEEVVTECKTQDKMLLDRIFLDPITLDDFLNLWDGVRETPGRIIVITSNFYSQLDPALVRPGRIDIGYEMKNVSHAIIQEMHIHFFGKTMKDEDISIIQPLFYSPAELVNIFLSSDFNETNYLTRLKENRKI